MSRAVVYRTGAEVQEALPWLDRLADCAMWLGGFAAYKEICARRRGIVCGDDYDLVQLQAEVVAAEAVAHAAGMPKAVAA
jgi:hypothetical protein